MGITYPVEATNCKALPQKWQWQYHVKNQTLNWVGAHSMQEILQKHPFLEVQHCLLLSRPSGHLVGTYLIHLYLKFFYIQGKFLKKSNNCCESHKPCAGNTHIISGFWLCNSFHHTFLMIK